MGRYRIPPWRVTLIVLLLTNLMWPFSYVPNALGFYYTYMGGYAHDEPTFFENAFANVCYPHPRTAIGGKLDAGIGQTGLDPLDPVHPLVGYRIVRVTQMTGRHTGVVASVEMQYRDAKPRTYDLAASGHQGCGEKWLYTNIDNLTAEHRELAYLPFATPASSVELSPPKLLQVHDDEQPHRVLPFVNAISGGYNGYLYNAEACWSPDGQAFLVLVNNQLWYVARNGSVVWKVANNAVQCAWNANGSQFVYVRSPHLNPYQTSSSPGRHLPYTVVAVNAKTRTQEEVGMTDRTTIAVVGNAVYYIRDTPESSKVGLYDPRFIQTLPMQVWRKSLDDRPAQSLGLLSSDQRESGPFAVSPDERRIIYMREGTVCVADVATLQDGGCHIRVYDVKYSYTDSGPTHMAWSHDNAQIAVVGPRNTPQREGVYAPPQLWLLDQDGNEVLQRQLGPYGSSAPVQWTPDDQHLIFSVFPGGKRVIGVEVATGEVRDLTQPRWDAFASLAPDGKSVLLWNGRGSFWTADVIVRPRSP